MSRFNTVSVLILVAIVLSCGEENHDDGILSTRDIIKSKCEYGIEHCEWIPRYFSSYAECVDIGDDSDACYRRRDNLICEYNCLKESCSDYRYCGYQCVIEFCTPPN